MSIALPKNPASDETTVGRQYLLYVDGGTTGTPKWVLLGGQRSTDRTLEAESIDTSHKTSGGWTTSKLGLSSWSIETSTVLMLQDEGMAILQACLLQKEDCHIKFEYPDGTYETGWGSVSNASGSTPYDGVAEGSLTITGNGALEQRQPAVSPVSAGFSKASAADIIMTLYPTTLTVTAVKLDGTALTTATQYTATAGTLTIKSTALTSKSVGRHLLEITTSDNGITITAHINVTA